MAQVVEVEILDTQVVTGAGGVLGPTRRPTDLLHVLDVQVDQVAEGPQACGARGLGRLAAIDLALGSKAHARASSLRRKVSLI